MKTPAEKVADALRALCFASGTSPDDGDEWSAMLVCDKLKELGVVGVPSCPRSCPLNRWLRRTTGFNGDPGDPAATLLLLTTERVLVSHPRVGRERAREFVDLPAAWVAAIRRITKLGLLEAA